MIYCLNCSFANERKSKKCAKCSSSLENCPEDSIIPEKILNKRYKLIAPLKSGGMAGIYLAKDIRLNSLCAVKELLLFFMPSDEVIIHLERFKQEAEILAKLRHPNLPRVIDYFFEYERYYLVMDYIEGEDLASILLTKGNPGLDEKDVAKWGATICDVLEYLHNQKPPIIYRDLKPSNIMLRKKDKQVMLIDFGIAKVLNPKDHTQSSVGTEGFAPLEQYRGNPEPRSDIYSLGATMHHLLSCATVVPFEFKPVRKYNSNISPKMESILIRALMKEPEYRYKCPSDMKKELISILEEEPVSLIERIKRRLDESISGLKPDSPNKIKVFLVEDESSISTAYERFIGYSKDLELSGIASNGLEAVEKYRMLEVKPDVVLMDISMPLMNGIEATEEIKKIDPSARVVILTALSPEKKLVLDAFKAGAVGYIIKGSKLSQITDAIRKAYQGGSPIEPAVASYLLTEISDRKPVYNEAELDNAIRFNLNEIDFITLLIELCSKAVTGKVDMKSPVENGFVYFDKGHIVHGVYGNIEGEEAIYQMINWTVGKGVFYPEVKIDMRTVLTDTEKVLAVLITRENQLKKIKEVVTSYNDVFTLELNATSAIIKLQPEQIYILAHVDGKNSVNEIVRKTGKTHFEVSKALYDLYISGIARKVK